MTEPDSGSLLRRISFVLIGVSVLVLVLFLFSFLDFGSFERRLGDFADWSHTRESFDFQIWFGKAFWIYLVPGAIVILVALIALNALIQAFTKSNKHKK
jgi:uncharacterized membrane protein YuzA (DUF378 family)